MKMELCLFASIGGFLMTKNSLAIRPANCNSQFINMISIAGIDAEI
jgi:hypothetical protein